MTFLQINVDFRLRRGESDITWKETYQNADGVMPQAFTPVKPALIAFDCIRVSAPAVQQIHLDICLL